MGSGADALPALKERATARAGGVRSDCVKSSHCPTRDSSTPPCRAIAAEPSPPMQPTASHCNTHLTTQPPPPPMWYLHRIAQRVELCSCEAIDQHGGARDVEDGVLIRELFGEHSSGLVGRHLSVRNEKDALQPVRYVDALCNPLGVGVESHLGRQPRSSGVHVVQARVGWAERGQRAWKPP